MPRLLTVFAGVVTLSLAGQGVSERTSRISNVTVIDVESGKEQPHTDVLIRGNTIAELVPHRDGTGLGHTPSVDGSGKFLIPGLWDMHVHADDERQLALFIANGVTSVRQMWGRPVHHQWQTRLGDPALVAPRLHIGSPIIDGAKPIWRDSIGVNDSSQARAAVRSTVAGGAAFIKVYSLLSREAYFAIVSEANALKVPFAGHVPYSVSLIEASQAGQQTVEHLSGVLLAGSRRETDFRSDLVAALATEVPYESIRAINSRDATALRESFDERRAQPLYQRLATTATAQTPTLVVLRNMSRLDDPALAQDPRLKYVPLNVRRAWQSDPRTKDRTVAEWKEQRLTYEKYKEIVRSMQRAGVLLLAGTDSSNPYCFAGFSLHDELALLVDAGLSPLQALRTATWNPARHLGMKDVAGSIAPGKWADAVLLDANPLADIRSTSRIAGVFVRGKYYSRQDLDALLRQAEMSHAR